MAKSMRTAFIRVSYTNKTSDGIVTYTREQIIATLHEWLYNTKHTYWVIEHEPESDDDDKNYHVHIVIKFNNPMPFENVKAKFPYGNIQTCKKLINSVQYLTHMNDPTKKQYSWDAVHTNCDDMTPYLLKTQHQQQYAIAHYLELIDGGQITYYNQYEEIPIDIWSKHKTQINNALEYYMERKLMDKNREIKVMFIYGETGTGKTTIAKQFAIKKRQSYCISSASNDPMQDYKNEEILILDDLRDSDFKFTDLLKMLDTHTHSTAKSRYKNKAFTGETIIITSAMKLQRWYAGVDEERKEQLWRRIPELIELTYDEMIISKYNEETRQYEKAAVAPNIVKMNIRKQFELGSELAKTLGIKIEPIWEQRYKKMIEESTDEELIKIKQEIDEEMDKN